MITNNDEWKNNVINFLNNHKNSENHDFIVGYCCHILSDIHNNTTLWIPFKQKYADEIEIYAAEIEKQKDNILNIWYAGKERQDLTSNEVVTVEIIMNFIKNAVDFVALTLQEHLN